MKTFWSSIFKTLPLRSPWMDDSVGITFYLSSNTSWLCLDIGLSFSIPVTGASLSLSPALCFPVGAAKQKTLSHSIFPLSCHPVVDAFLSIHRSPALATQGCPGMGTQFKPDSLLLVMYLTRAAREMFSFFLSEVISTVITSYSQAFVLI